jgi:hypothetical protein
VVDIRQRRGPLAEVLLTRPMLLDTRQPLLQEAHVAAVCTPQNVEGVAEERHCADKAVDHDIAEHAYDDMARCTELARFVHDVKRHRGGNSIADPRHEPDQGIETESHIDARKDKRRIQQGRQRIDPSDPLTTRTLVDELKTVVGVGTVASITVDHLHPPAAPNRDRKRLAQVLEGPSSMPLTDRFRSDILPMCSSLGGRMPFDQSTRRELVVLGGGATAWPLAARAQQTAVPVIAFMSGRSRAESAAVLAAFQRGLGETGYVEGRNLAIEYRWAEGHYDRLPAFAAELAARRVAVIAATAGTQLPRSSSHVILSKPEA